MYFSSSDEEITNEEDTDICLICWLPSENNNIIKELSSHSYIIKICNCNPKIHTDCLNKWIGQNPSCPICRKTLTICINEVNDDYNNILTNMLIYCYLYYCINNYTINCIKCILIVVKVSCYLCFINILCLYIYNIYLIIDEHSQDDNN